MNLPKSLRRELARDRKHPEYAGRDPRWEPPKDDPVDENGLTRDQRRIWQEFMAE